jgi:hypothetical protein
MPFLICQIKAQILKVHRVKAFFCSVFAASASWANEKKQSITKIKTIILFSKSVSKKDFPFLDGG